MRVTAVALMISIIAFFAITGETVNLKTEKDMAETPEGCPYVEDDEYTVTVKGSVSSLKGGCAYIHYNASDKLPQTYSLWFGNSHHDRPHCSNNGIIYFNFHCISNSPSPSADISKGRMYINKVWLFDENNKTEDRRCAFYEKIKYSDTTLRMAISKTVSCDGLADLLYDPNMSPRDTKGSLLMIFNSTRPYSLTATKRIQSTSTWYQNRWSILQNLTNLQNPFWRTEETTEGGTSRRLRRHVIQMSAEDGKNSAAMDLSSYDNLKPDVNDNDVSNATVKDTDLLHRPLEINNKQLRGPESSVMPSPKTVLAGANPFALLLANRVHNNKTGSIKPIGIWDQFLKLFNN
ncbi:uncharacterized protein LOC111028548 isoform X2 [Myzus persicae]|uniref:uncharacterized protein LOC111028548 isoform X2 n=1 Tax=Myzus persicae TaxID=13164 RepID=UPI000B93654A|nr:uncharacterized protein LOC111028548 isoform X2 [Myzus persicae]